MSVKLTIALAPLALMSLGGAALAADIPGNSSTHAVLQVSKTTTPGKFETIDDSDWYRVTLQKGSDYTVFVDGGLDCCSTVVANLRDANGKVLAHATSFTGDETDGFEYRAKKSGLYYLEYKQTYGRSDAGPYDYDAQIAGDCRGDITTHCSLAVGSTYTGLLAYGTDLDDFKVSLTASKHYTITSKPTGSSGEDTVVYLLDAKGKKIAGGTGPTLTNITPPGTGTYFIKLATGDAAGGAGGYGTSYTLSLKSN